MFTFYKYPIKLDELGADGKFTIQAYQEHKILLVDTQDGKPFIWMWVNKESSKCILKFKLIETSQLTDCHALSHIASFQDRPFVWHLFEDGGEYNSFTGEDD